MSYLNADRLDQNSKQDLIHGSVVPFNLKQSIGQQRPHNALPIHFRVSEQQPFSTLHLHYFSFNIKNDTFSATNALKEVITRQH